MKRLVIPKHVAIVMDGNGRWAQARHYPRVYGHIRGSARVREVVREASCVGVKALTLFAFSTENWKRPPDELSVLWRLLKKYLIREVEELNRQNVRLRIIGEIGRLQSDVQDVITKTIGRLDTNTGLTLTIALSYGGRREIAVAAQHFASDCLSGRAKIEDLNDESSFNKYLWTSSLQPFSDVDLLIRTSGERRISNFLLWQLAYAEFVFLDLFWPDFSASDFASALNEYSIRERRFGALVTDENQVV